MSASDPRVSADQTPAELGYKPELSRLWSGFSNCALLLLWPAWELGVHRGVPRHSG
jgi:hypothetical protein